MRLAGAILNLVKKHEATLHPVLDTDMISAKDKVAEFLMVFAEEFDLSPDLVAPGQGYVRSREGARKRKWSAAGNEFFEAQSARALKISKSEVLKSSQAEPLPAQAKSTTDVEILCGAAADENSNKTEHACNTPKKVKDEKTND